MNLLKPFIILSLIVTSALSLAQQSLYLDLEILNQNAQVFKLGDLDFTKTGLTENYFNIRLRNDGTEPIHMRLKLEILYNGNLIAWALSDDFSLPADGVTYLITNQQLTGGTAVIGAQPPIGLSDSDVDLDAVEDLENQVLRTGFAPAGTYDFVLKAVDPNDPNSVIGDDQVPQNHSLFISNPTYIELLFPGASVSQSGIQEIATIFPYFQWQTDVPPMSATYDIFVHQKYAEDETTQDVLNHPPMLRVRGYTNNFLQYPTDTSPIDPAFEVVRPLETGRIYYWLVRSTVLSGTGPLTLESDVFRFKIADAGAMTGDAQQILAVLQQILGTKYEQVLQNLLEQGFDPNGNLTLDGRSVDLQALLEIANQISRGEVTIQDVEIY